jgi:hypothetical protein
MPDVLKTVIGIVAHTPIWVWFLYALLLFLGFQRTRDSALPVWRMLILPAVVAILAIVTFISAGPDALPAMLVGIVIGGAAGWRLERDGATRRLADGRLWVRGEWWSFAQLVLVLIFRYVTSVASAMNPALNANPSWRWSALAIAAALSALFIGRAAARLRVYNSAAQKTA